MIIPRFVFAYIVLTFSLLFAEKTVLITGGAGFLGSNLCDSIIQRGDNVICVDNMSSGSVENVAHLISNPSFKLVVQDIGIPLDIQGPVDEIYNLACPASPDFYQKDPIHTLKTNFMGMMNILELAIQKNAKVLQTSTSEVYGDPEVHPQTESYWGNVNCYGLRSCYDEGKRVAETLCFAYRQMHKVDVKIVRIFNTFGPKMHPNDGRVVSNFIVQALSNKPLTIYGDGSQTRSLCYVDDMIDGFILTMAQPYDFSGPVNLGNPSREMTVLEIAKMIIELTGTKSSICFKPLPQDDPKKRQPDITLANTALGWSPKVSVKDGLNRTIKYYMTLIQKSDKP